MRGGSHGVRASINGQQFIECGVLRGGSLMLGPAIGTNKEVLFVDSWNPAADAMDVDMGHSIKVNLHATDTQEHEIYVTDDGDWEADGTLADTVEVGNVLQLGTSNPSIDFEDYTVDTSITSGVQPDSWTQSSQTSAAIIRDDYGDGNQYAHWDCYNNVFHVLFTDISTISDGECEVMVRADSSGGAGAAHTVFYNCTGSGDAMRGHLVQFSQGGSTIICRRVYDWNSFSGVGSPVSLGQTFNADTWYHIKLKTSLYNGDTQIGCQFKFWKDGDAEPASYTWLYGDNIYVQAGYYGFGINGSALSPKGSYDNFKVWPSPATYVGSGTWTADGYDVTSVEHYSSAIVTWDEVLPTDTDATISIRWRDTDSWAAVSNGGYLPGIDRGDNMEAGSPYTTLQCKVELATTDTSATPEISNFRVYFEPVSEGALEVDLDGDYSCTVANGLLDYWGREQVSGGSEFLAWDDIWIQTRVPRWVTLLGKGADITINYSGVFFQHIVINMARDYWLEAAAEPGMYYGLTPLVYESAPAELRWGCADIWGPFNHTFEWVLIDRGIAIHADAWWICGHYQLDNHPGSYIAAALDITDHPGSLQVNGWMLNNHPGEALIQGWRTDNHPGSFLPGVWYRLDTPGEFVVGSRFHDDNPGMVVVYGVNREGHIEVNVVTADTWAAMVAAGYGVA